MTSTVRRIEAKFYKKKGESNYFDLNKDLRENKIIEICPSVEDVKIIQDKFDPRSAPILHIGELEAITFLMRQEISDIKFCSGDFGAIRAMVILDIGELAISLEEALKQCGLLREVEPKFSEAIFKECMENAKLQRIYDTKLIVEE
ncbi:hypothetical protein CEE39_03915 [bacterium (candidate division B38) B3_B38]|nr:MAG: hypothetical protein CEE39_03915 [bacterium (candidate division B38) B3_B38]